MGFYCLKWAICIVDTDVVNDVTYTLVLLGFHQQIAIFFNDNVIHCIVKHKEEWSFHLKIYETSLWRVL